MDPYLSRDTLRSANITFSNSFSSVDNRHYRGYPHTLGDPSTSSGRRPADRKVVDIRHFKSIGIRQSTIGISKDILIPDEIPRQAREDGQQIGK